MMKTIIANMLLIVGLAFIGCSPSSSASLDRTDPGENGPDLVTVRITNKQGPVINNDSKAQAPARETYIDSHAETNTWLNNHTNFLSRPCSALRIIVQDYDDEYSAIQLPPDINRRLLEYLNYGPETKPFDCGYFVHFLMDEPYWGNFDASNVNCTDIQSPRNLSPGEFVVVWGHNNDTNRPQIAVHFGLSLGNSLFLWKFGPTSGLFVSDMKAMERLFDGFQTQLFTRKFTVPTTR